MNILRAGALVLEPQVAAHAAEMFHVLGDPAIYEFENAPPESEAWLARRFALLETRRSPGGGEQWLNWVVRLPTGELAGYVQATITRDRCAHIAYVLASQFWRQGIGSAAVTAMLDELAASYGVSIAAATLNARNHRSLGLLRSLGFYPSALAGQASVSHAEDEIVMYRSSADGLTSLGSAGRLSPETTP